MAKVLHIVASPRWDSYSARLGRAFLDAYRKAAPDDRVEVLDLFSADIPPFRAPQAKAKYAVLAYLRGIFGFIGFTDIRAVRIQNTLMSGPEQLEADLRRAVAQAQEEALRFGVPAPAVSRA